MKLSWQALHLKLTPRNTCAEFCAACIHGVTAALVSPRQLTPMTNPAGSPGCVGLISLASDLVVGRVVGERRQQVGRDALAAAAVGIGEVGQPSSLRSRSFQNDIQCSA